MLTRRDLKFTSMEDVWTDAEHLHRVGYLQAGKWDLAQVLNHLVEWMRFPMDGFPKMPLPVKIIMWGLRNTIGKRQLRQFLEGKPFPVGTMTVNETVFASGQDAQKALDHLREMIGRMNRFEGTIHPSPLFGALTREQWFAINLIHCAHHLSFLVPK